MRFPIKFNRTNWPEFITKLLPSAVDPRVLYQKSTNVDEAAFSKAVSTFKFGTTLKSTHKARFPLTIRELASLTYHKRPVILDVGASDGSTSLDVMRAVPFETYYVTDLNIEVYYQETENKTWFYDEKGNCILVVSNEWVIYPDIGGAIFPFDKITQSIFARVPKPGQNTQSIKLLTPQLKSQNNNNIVIEKYNIFDLWPYQKPDLIIVANILNRSYFTSSEIEEALKKLVSAIKGEGRIAIIDNRPSEQSTIFQFRAGNVYILKKVNGGTEIENLAMKIFESIKSSAILDAVSEKV